jgi:hypothetical protein
MGRGFVILTSKQWSTVCGLAILSSVVQLIRSGGSVDQNASLVPATWGNIMRVHCRHWLEYDSVALAVLVIAIGIVELLVLII